MDDLVEQVTRAAAKVVEMSDTRNGQSLDFTEASLSVVEEMIDEASSFAGEMTPEQRDVLVQDFGCYILEVARRDFGGRYQWFDQRDQPVLIVGEPAFRVALITWDKVRGRLSGEPADDISFFYAGFTKRARTAQPGTDALYV